MRIDPQQRLFVGVKVDNKLRDALEHCAPRDRVYFDGSDPRYLQVVRIDSSSGESFVGKVIASGTTASSMDDLKRNILSLLARLSTGRRGDDDVKIFALGEGEPPPIEVKDPVEHYQ